MKSIKILRLYQNWTELKQQFKFTFSRLVAAYLTFFHHQVTVNSTMRYQIIRIIFIVLGVDSVANISTLRHKFPSN